VVVCVLFAFVGVRVWGFLVGCRVVLCSWLLIFYRAQGRWGVVKGFV
jgi:hypothetical protein